MKIFLLADANSVHIIKWAISLQKRGFKITIFSLGDLSIVDYQDYPDIKIFSNNYNISRKNGAFSKLKYLSAFSRLNKIIKVEKPDLVHAHYATSYGLLGALLNFKPFVLSLWGSDIFGFPKKSIFHKSLMKFNLSKADKILSTSKVMANEVSFYTNKKVTVTPFGIDLAKFKFNHNLNNHNEIVIGTVKSLEYIYGIDILIKAFKYLYDKYPKLSLKLLIVGKGSLKKELEKLVKELSLQSVTSFTGTINHDLVPKYHNMIDVAVYLSREESFGVAVLESCSVSKPVVVSNAGGLPEVVVDNKTGFVVEKEDYISAAKKIEKLILNPDLRKKMGENGRKRVMNEYCWDKNVNQMIDIYKELLK